MEPKPLLRIGGSAWEIARAFLLFAYLAVASSASGAADMLSAPWLAAVGSAGLVMPAAFVMYAVAPDRFSAFLPLLRLGKGLEAASILLLFATRAVAAVTPIPGTPITVPLLGYPPVTFGLAFALDLLVLAGLVRMRGRP